MDSYKWFTRTPFISDRLFALIGNEYTINRGIMPWFKETLHQAGPTGLPYDFPEEFKPSFYQAIKECFI
jgi:hypothetical protein